jgi:hypothetical protein
MSREAVMACPGPVTRRHGAHQSFTLLTHDDLQSQPTVKSLMRPVPDAATALLNRFRRDERGELVPAIAKAAIAIAFLSVIAANMMANRIDAHEKSAMAAISADAARGRAVDSAATGSLASRANATKMDPCVLDNRR